MFAPPKDIETRVFARMPESLHRTNEPSEWVDARGGGPIHSFLEGPAFDRSGNLYCVDLAHSRIFRISPSAEWEVFADYDGEPNGLKIHKDGTIYVADHRHGVLAFDPETREMRNVRREAHREGFKGLNDLVFDRAGNLYFTDQGQSAIEDPTGRVYRLRPTGELDLLYKGMAGPNGLVLNKAENILHVAVTRTNQILSLPLTKSGGVHKVRMFIQLSGSPTGPDGMAVDQHDNIAIVHAGFGTVWQFSAMGEPLYRIRSCAGTRTTNVAYGGKEGRTLFITEAEQGVILTAELPVAGHPLYSHAE